MILHYYYVNSKYVFLILHELLILYLNFIAPPLRKDKLLNKIRFLNHCKCHHQSLFQIQEVDYNDNYHYNAHALTVSVKCKPF